MTDQTPTVFPGTPRHNHAVAERLPLDDPRHFADAQRGWLASLPEGGVPALNGRIAWDNTWFDFLNDECPDTVNPSLWFHAQVNAVNGLFKVTDGMWQARGCDMANMTIIEGDTGWIIIDPLISEESAGAVLALVNATLGERPVSAVIVTHSHADHFGGILGVTGHDPDAWPPIYVPDGFTEAAASEGLLGGIHMSRRAVNQFGTALPLSPIGAVDGGIGKTVARGRRGFARPSHIIDTGDSGQVTQAIDGVTFEFMSADGTEAPAEIVFLLPDHGVLCMAEVCTQSMHNVLTPRGAQIRDSLHWSRCIDTALLQFAHRADILVNCHNWPVWGREETHQYLLEQRDVYKYIHDQSLRLANHGMTIDEVGAAIEEPDFMVSELHTRGYYGSLSFNARANYQRYYGFFDGRPVNLSPLPPEELGRRYTDAFGGPDQVIALAASAIERDDLQWASTLLNHVVFAGEDGGAKALLADVYRNQGYREESGIMRNMYLAGAKELDDGVPRLPGAGGRNAALAATLKPVHWFDMMAVRLNPERSRGEEFAIRFEVDGDPVLVSVARQTEFARSGAGADSADAGLSMTLTLAQLELLVDGELDLAEADPVIAVQGDVALLDRWLDLHDTFDMWFNIATP